MEINWISGIVGLLIIVAGICAIFNIGKAMDELERKMIEDD